jgi:hypothetical protein
MRQITVPTEAILSIVTQQLLGDPAETFDLLAQVLLRPVDAGNFVEASQEARSSIQRFVPWAREFTTTSVGPDVTKWLGSMNAVHGDKQLVYVGDGAEPASTRNRPQQP